MRTVLLIPLQQDKDLSLPFFAKVEKILIQGEIKGVILSLHKEEKLEIWEDDVQKRRKSFYSTSSYSYTLQGIKRENNTLVVQLERNVQIKARFPH